jgi:hypothetical protein
MVSPLSRLRRASPAVKRSLWLAKASMALTGPDAWAAAGALIPATSAVMMTSFLNMTHTFADRR